MLDSRFYDRDIEDAAMIIEPHEVTLRALAQYYGRDVPGELGSGFASLLGFEWHLDKRQWIRHGLPLPKEVTVDWLLAEVLKFSPR
jgi:hypothetical protein